MTYAENTWCVGCGNFGIQTAVRRAVEILGEETKERLVMSCGIGCHGKIFDYLKISGLYSLHGRSIAAVQGMKVANPLLKVITFCGDGDAYGEGIAHLIFAAKRNADITVIVHNNGVYGLTTGQYTPTSEKGFKGRSTPRGSVEEPLNPLVLLLEAGATFVGRGYSGKVKNLTDVIVKAVEHEGFSFVDVLQPCVSYNNTYKKYNEMVVELEKTPETFEEALEVARRKDKLYVGVLYRTEKPVFHRELYGDWNPVAMSLSREERMRRVKDVMEVAEW